MQQLLTLYPSLQDARLKVLGTAKSTSTTPGKRVLPSSAKGAHHASFDDCFGEKDPASGSESEDSVIGTTTRRRAFLDTSSSLTAFTRVELRLYRKLTSTPDDGYGPVFPYGPMMLTSDCATAHDCFNRICEKIQTDCSFMVFQLPEDMQGVVGGIRVNRGSGDAEVIFQRVLEIFRQAKRFPGEPQYRSIEVEVGLDIPEDD